MSCIQVKLNFVEGFGFTGIAVALMGRNHPIGVILASILFGFLYQGGAEHEASSSGLTVTSWWYCKVW